MRWGVGGVFVVVAVAACGGGRSHAAPRTAAAPAPVKRARLTYRLPGLAPLPFVHGTFGDQPAWALVDSGAGAHVASTWLVERAGVRTQEKGDGVEDHARVAMAASRTDASALVLDGWGRVAPGDMLVVDAQDASMATRAGVGVVLAPQRLADRRAVVVDFERAEIRAADETGVERALATRRHDPLVGGVHVCRGTFDVSATIDGQPVTLTIDTGANTSTVYAESPAGRALAPRAVANHVRAESASGPVTTRTYRAARVKAGAWEITTDVAILPGGPGADCPADGVLGFDQLRSCVLVFGPKRDVLRARCGAR